MATLFGRRLFVCASAVVASGLATAAQAQIGSGWTRFYPSSFIDFQCGGTHIHKSLASYIRVQGGVYEYNSSTGIETFWLDDNTCNRVERRHDEHYTSGKRQMEGDVKINRVSSQSVHQVFHGSSGPYIMVKGYTGNGGELRKLSGSVVLASGIEGVFRRYNYLHQVGSYTEIYINGVRKYRGGGAALDGSGNNNKYGIYGTKVTLDPTVQWKWVKHFK